MRIKARMGVSVDGFVSGSAGTPTVALADGFVPGVSHGYPEFIEGCDAAVMGGRRSCRRSGRPRGRGGS